MSDTGARVIIEVERDKVADVLAAVAKVLDTPEPLSTLPASGEWNDTHLAALAALIVGRSIDADLPAPTDGPDFREQAMLRLLLSDPRPLVPQTELRAKFGTAVPPSLNLDLPGLAKFCADERLRFPLELTSGDPAGVRRSLTPLQVLLLRGRINSIESSSMPRVTEAAPSAHRRAPASAPAD